MMCVDKLHRAVGSISNSSRLSQHVVRFSTVTSPSLLAGNTHTSSFSEATVVLTVLLMTVLSPFPP